ncbi:uncharacterized protein METZ01_LOCUS328924, partial [marine metagenome]
MIIVNNLIQWDVIADIASISNPRNLSADFNGCSRNQEIS